MFTAIYRNTPEVRAQVLGLIAQIIQQGNDINNVHLRHPLCVIRNSWPDMRERLNLPLNMQCEEMEFVNGEIKSRQLQVIDIAVEITETTSLTDYQV